MYWGLFNASIGLFMCLYVRFTLTHIKNSHSVQEKLLDLELVSIEDYSITGNISREFFE